MLLCRQLVRLAHQLFDTPPFCTWAQEACRLLFKGKVKQFHQCLSPSLRESHSPERLKQLLTDLKKHFTQDLEIRRAHYEFGSQCNSKSSVGWCDFSLAHGSVNQSLIVGVSRTATNAFEIDTLRWETWPMTGVTSRPDPDLTLFVPHDFFLAKFALTATIASTFPLTTGKAAIGFEFGQSIWVALAFDTREEAERKCVATNSRRSVASSGDSSLVRCHRTAG